VPPGSPLARAGLAKNDVIVAVNGDSVRNVAALLRQAPALADDQSLSLGVWRTQKETNVTVRP
jgi:S1-C subfamily serine protease